MKKILFFIFFIAFGNILCICKSQYYNFGIAEDIGRRSKFEDTHCILKADNNLFVGLFDGHGGKDVAEFAASNLYKEILFKLKSELSDAQIKKIIMNGFLNTQQNLSQYEFSFKQGCTAIVSIFYGNKIYISNLGDSRAVVCNNGKAIALSRDHKPTMPDERERIEKLGGKITVHGVPRVNGILAVSRALGDRALNPYVSFVPEISDYELSKNDDFLILACDGVWDVLSNQKAVDVVKSALKEGRNCNLAAEKLKDIAFFKGSSDNISVIVIDLKNIKFD